MFDRLKRAIGTVARVALETSAGITKLIDTAHEAAHAVSACVELAREAESNRYSAADAFRDGILNKENGRLVDERDRLRVELKSTTQERDNLAHKLDWLTRWRETPCPFPPEKRVLARFIGADGADCADGWYVSVLNEHKRDWRPANLDLYEEFRDA